MIQPLRTVHRTIFFLLLIALPILLGAALRARRIWSALPAEKSATSAPASPQP